MIVKCDHCGQKNRVPAKRVDDAPACGKCKEDIERTEYPVTIEPGEFDALLAESSRPVLVDFTATWCGPCKAVAPELEKLAAQRSDLLVAKLDIDSEPTIASREQVRGVPTFKLYVGGKATKSISGYRTLSQLNAEFPA
jgi:thioredoxin 2